MLMNRNLCTQKDVRKNVYASLSVNTDSEKFKPEWGFNWGMSLDWTMVSSVFTAHLFVHKGSPGTYLTYPLYPHRLPKIHTEAEFSL